MKRGLRGILIFAVGALSLLSAVSARAMPILELPAMCRQGDVLVARLLSPHPLGSAELFLRMPDGKDVKPAKSLSFRLESGEYAAVAFLPLPMYAPTGQASLLFEAMEGSFAVAQGRTFEIHKREYPSMDIKLDPANTSIKASPDPQKNEESRILTALLYVSDPAAAYLDGPFVRPLQEKAVTATYGDNRRYLYSGGGSSQSVHTGLDLHHDYGVPIRACGRGKVVFSKFRIVTGNTVVIEHASGLYSLYYHMESLAVSEGEMVEIGRIVGKVGSTGLSTGPHLHWELRLRAEALDPECLIGHPLLDKTRAIYKINTSDEGR